MKLGSDGSFPEGQSQLYRSVAAAYKRAKAKGATEESCLLQAAKEVRNALPILLPTEAERLARRILQTVFRAE